MDFFQRQNAARRSTAVLTLYFVIAVVLTTVAVNVGVYLAFGAGGFLKNGLNVMTHSGLGSVIDKPLWIWSTLGTLLVIGSGSLTSYVRLKGGGRSVARMMDARLVDLNTTDPREKRLINVVEEMSIASGTPVPELYVQDGELGINAFVAGYHIREAVLCVTEGALANLTRDELQGVVGHEFSHILNGDMRINVRLIAVLAGIIVVSQLGGFLMRGSMHSRRYRVSGSDNNSGIVSAGLILFVLGYIGLFFGRLIKAAISRQREYLADAAAVQFTRNPDGIAGALHKIKHLPEKSYLGHAHAEDMSHMCFGETMKYRFTNLFATHPQIEQRIKAIHPRFIAPETLTKPDDRPDSSGKTESKPATVSPTTMMNTVVTAQILMGSVGTPSPAHVDYARQIHAQFSDAVIDSTHQPLDARAVVYALVLAGASPEDFARARKIVVDEDGEDTATRIAEVLTDIRKLGPASRLPLVELTFPALGRLHRDQKDDFVASLEKVIKSDGRYTLFEFALLTLIRKHLNIDAGKIDQREYTKLGEVRDHVETLISLFARLGATDDKERSALFKKSMTTFGFDNPNDIRKASADQLSVCLNHLDLLSPLLKRPVIHACVDCVIADNEIKPIEIELLRATCAVMDCPMPPVIPGTMAVEAESA